MLDVCKNCNYVKEDEKLSDILCRNCPNDVHDLIYICRVLDCENLSDCINFCKKCKLLSVEEIREIIKFKFSGEIELCLNKLSVGEFMWYLESRYHVSFEERVDYYLMVKDKGD